MTAWSSTSHRTFPVMLVKPLIGALLKTLIFTLFGMPSWLTARALDFGLPAALATGLSIMAAGVMLWRALAPLQPWSRAVPRLMTLYVLWFGAAVLAMALLWSHWHMTPG